MDLRPCVQCPAGSQCPFSDQEVVEACLGGMYSVGGQLACSNCPAGYFCPESTRENFVPCSTGP